MVPYSTLTNYMMLNRKIHYIKEKTSPMCYYFKNRTGAVARVRLYKPHGYVQNSRAAQPIRNALQKDPFIDKKRDLLHCGEALN